MKITLSLMILIKRLNLKDCLASVYGKNVVSERLSNLRSLSVLDKVLFELLLVFLI